METLNIDKKTAIKLYPKADPEFRELLHEKFGAKTFSTDVCDFVNRLEDACRETGKQPSSNPDPYKQAEENIEIFAEAMRQGKPAGECYYYPFFLRSAGGGLSLIAYGGDRGSSSVGARLRVPDRKSALHMGRCMIEYYEIMDKG